MECTQVSVVFYDFLLKTDAERVAILWTEVSHTFQLYMFRIARAGIFPRSSLLGAGQLGFWEFGEGGTVG